MIRWKIFIDEACQPVTECVAPRPLGAYPYNMATVWTLTAAGEKLCKATNVNKAGHIISYGKASEVWASGRKPFPSRTDHYLSTGDHLVHHLPAVGRGCAGPGWYRSNPGNMCLSTVDRAGYAGLTRQHEPNHSRSGMYLSSKVEIIMWESMICPRDLGQVIIYLLRSISTDRSSSSSPTCCCEWLCRICTVLI